MAYALIVGLTMFALPLGSIGLELHFGAAHWLWLIGKWFVFWGVGVRLLLAGLRQYLQPGFTSRDIIGIDSAEVYLLVRELGGANLASGVVGLASLALPSFVLPAAIASGIFYALAGVEHLRSKHRGINETIALVSDLFIAVVLIGFAVAALLRGLR